TRLETLQECLKPSLFDGLICGVELRLRLKGGREQERDDEMAAMADEVPAMGEMAFEACGDRIQERDARASARKACGRVRPGHPAVFGQADAKNQVAGFG